MKTLWPSPKAEKNHQRTFLPGSKGRKRSITTCQLLQGSLPYQDGLSPKEVTVLVGGRHRSTLLSGAPRAVGLPGALECQHKAREVSPGQTATGKGLESPDPNGDRFFIPQRAWPKLLSRENASRTHSTTRGEIPSTRILT